MLGGGGGATTIPTAPMVTIENMNQKLSSDQQNIIYASAIQIETQPHQNHIPVYDPARGGYVNGTGPQGDIHGNYNNYGNSGVGVNNIPDGQSTVAYGGALGAPYGSDPYSVIRTHRSEVHPDPTSTSTSSYTHTSISMSDYSAGYGNDPYSVKRK